MSAPALILIDLQRAIDDPVWRADGPRNHLDAEKRAGDLLALWRIKAWPVFHVRHESTTPGSPYAPISPFKPEVAPIEGEPVIGKSARSAFVGTALELRLRDQGIVSLVIAGVITNNSVEATVRHASDLGFKVFLVHDACFTFARRDYSGVSRSAEAVHAMSLANLDGEYAQITTVEGVASLMGRSDAADGEGGFRRR